MKLLTTLLLPAFIGAASALSDASVYILQGDEWPKTSTPPTLSPEQARLVLAQRLGVSQYHGLGDASDVTLAYINNFGGRPETLFQEAPEDKAAELVLIVEGISSETSKPILNAWSSSKPAFTISKPPSMHANKKLVKDLHHQSKQEGKICPFADAINPFDKNCWNGASKVLHFDMADKKSGGIDEFMPALERLRRFARKGEMNVVVVLMPESSRSTISPSKPYGSYENDGQIPMRRQAEEPMTESPSASSFPKFNSKIVSNSSDKPKFVPIKGVPALCHSSLDACISSTNNCSGHGTCFKKYGAKGDDGKGGCFTCQCVPNFKQFLFNGNDSSGTVIENWGGAACHKKDVSSAFWLIATFTVVIVGLISWGIGLMFAIGEEKLPGVIGAGVSSKAR